MDINIAHPRGQAGLGDISLEKTEGYIRVPGLVPCPPNGRHAWIMHAAHRCLWARLSVDEALRHISALLTRPPRPGEIEDALRSAGATHVAPAREGTTYLKRPVKAAFDPSVLARIAAKLPEASVSWLIAKSPVPPHSVDGETFLQHIFYPGEHALIFSKYKSQGQLLWTHDETPCPELSVLRIGQPEGVWFLANPCDGTYREVERLRKPANATGHTRRAEENIISFRHALIESDDAPPELWLRALCQMPLPILSIVTSGGRSLHALVRINAASKVAWDEVVRGQLLQPLAILGADPAAMSAVRLTRLPGCLRYGKSDNAGNFQPFAKGPSPQLLLFLNPQADGTPIMELNGNSAGGSAQ